MRACVRACAYLQGVVDPSVEVLELVLGDGGVVGAEELLHLQPGQAAVTAPLPQPARRLGAPGNHQGQSRDRTPHWIHLIS